MKHRKAPATLGLNLEFRHQNKAIILTASSSFPSKIVTGMLQVYTLYYFSAYDLIVTLVVRGAE